MKQQSDVNDKSSALKRSDLAMQHPILPETISLDEFARVKMRVGKVLEAKNVEGSEKLIRLVVDIGEEKSRIIFTGVRPFGYTPEDFVGKQSFSL